MASKFIPGRYAWRSSGKGRRERIWTYIKGHSKKTGEIDDPLGVTKFLKDEKTLIQENKKTYQFQAKDIEGNPIFIIPGETSSRARANAKRGMDVYLGVSNYDYLKIKVNRASKYDAIVNMIGIGILESDICEMEGVKECENCGNFYPSEIYPECCIIPFK